MRHNVLAGNALLTRLGHAGCDLSPCSESQGLRRSLKILFFLKNYIKNLFYYCLSCQYHGCIKSFISLRLCFSAGVYVINFDRRFDWQGTNFSSTCRLHCLNTEL